MRVLASADIHGHVHHAPGRQGNHFTVAAAATRRALLIDLSTVRHEVPIAEGTS